MKLCPLCTSTYADRVDFCFRDGTPLLREPKDGGLDDHDHATNGGHMAALSSHGVGAAGAGRLDARGGFETDVLFDPDDDLIDVSQNEGPATDGLDDGFRIDAANDETEDAAAIDAESHIDDVDMRENLFDDDTAIPHTFDHGAQTYRDERPEDYATPVAQDGRERLQSWDDDDEVDDQGGLPDSDFVDSDPAATPPMHAPSIPDPAADDAAALSEAVTDAGPSDVDFASDGDFDRDEGPDTRAHAEADTEPGDLGALDRSDAERGDAETGGSEDDSDGKADGGDTSDTDSGDTDSGDTDPGDTDPGETDPGDDGKISSDETLADETETLSDETGTADDEPLTPPDLRFDLDDGDPDDGDPDDGHPDDGGLDTPGLHADAVDDTLADPFADDGSSTDLFRVPDSLLEPEIHSRLGHDDETEPTAETEEPDEPSSRPRLDPVAEDGLEELAAPVFGLDGESLADPSDVPEPSDLVGRVSATPHEVEHIQSAELGLQIKGARALGPRGVVIPSQIPPETTITEPLVRSVDADTEEGATAPMERNRPVVDDDDDVRAPVPIWKRFGVIAGLATAAVVVLGISVVLAAGVFSGSKSTPSAAPPAVTATPPSGTTPTGTAPTSAAPASADPTAAVVDAPVDAAAAIEAPPTQVEATTPPPVVPIATEPAKPVVAATPKPVTKAAPKPVEKPVVATTTKKPAAERSTTIIEPTTTKSAPVTVATVEPPTQEDIWGVSNAPVRGTLRILGVGDSVGAKVSVNGVSRGTLVAGVPLTVGDLELHQSYKIQLTKDGFVSETRQQSLETEKEPITVTFTDLVPLVRQGTLVLTGASGSTVTVDGGMTYTIPDSISVKEGSHSFRVTGPDGSVFTQKVTVKFNDESRAEVFLSPPKSGP